MVVSSTPLILVIDTSAAQCSVVVHDGERLRASVNHEPGRALAERIVGYCADVLRDAGADWSAVTEIAVVVGPGSFAGLRAGVAAARGFGVALGVPVQGITTLEAIARAARGREVLATLPGPRDLVFAQPFDRDGAPLADAVLGSVEEIGERWTSVGEIVGPAADCFSDVHRAADLPIGDVALLAWERARSDERRPAEPFYLRDAVTPPARSVAENAVA